MTPEAIAVAVIPVVGAALLYGYLIGERNKAKKGRRLSTPAE